MAMPSAGSIFSLEEFDNLNFHDCHVHGIRWEPQTYTLILDLDYIFEWIKKESRYHFLVARAEMKFDYVASLRVSLDWDSLPLECQIDDITKKNDASCANDHCLWKIVFSVPYGHITFESPCFKLRILTDPQERPLPYLA